MNSEQLSRRDFLRSGIRLPSAGAPTEPLSPENLDLFTIAHSNLAQAEAIQSFAQNVLGKAIEPDEIESRLQGKTSALISAITNNQSISRRDFTHQLLLPIIELFKPRDIPSEFELRQLYSAIGIEIGNFSITFNSSIGEEDAAHALIGASLEVVSHAIQDGDRTMVFDHISSLTFRSTQPQQPSYTIMDIPIGKTVGEMEVYLGPVTSQRTVARNEATETGHVPDEIQATVFTNQRPDNSIIWSTMVDGYTSYARHYLILQLWLNSWKEGFELPEHLERFGWVKPNDREIIEMTDRELTLHGFRPVFSEDMRAWMSLSRYTSKQLLTVPHHHLLYEVLASVYANEMISTGIQPHEAALLYANLQDEKTLPSGLSDNCHAVEKGLRDLGFFSPVPEQATEAQLYTPYQAVFYSLQPPEIQNDYTHVVFIDTFAAGQDADGSPIALGTADPGIYRIEIHDGQDTYVATADNSIIFDRYGDIVSVVYLPDPFTATKDGLIHEVLLSGKSITLYTQIEIGTSQGLQTFQKKHRIDNLRVS
ncbi:MAG: hypothetical protein UU78_C0030G0001 [Candidatus Roizmanbacteria bacterium GW2011_GWC2_41_7]|uniref:Uncharacterized protein n=1 Tax=Candidatus Roizmanbacteria bacterium GW2011_GWC2_41_7 TaxID=1618487 RepID=A0A0G0XA11_9BACT|nr:MAG: hypothetical protein UU78_C0030G0001 [Candidatus Roizmanbacteria bacterium GW2011_GWC2_41_7]